MRIAFVGHFNERRAIGDMGTRAVARHLSTEMERYHEVRRVDIRDLSAWIGLRDFQPDIIHLVLGPSNEGMLASWLCQLPLRRTRLVLSVPNPSPSLWGSAVRRCDPDLALVQSERSERFFKSLGVQVRFLANGVDMDRFVPVPPQARQSLRVKHEIDPDRFTLLHVGPLIPGRNLIPLAEVADGDHQVVIIGREPADRRIKDRLTDAGCLIITHLVERIEEFYQLADCYVFPVPPEQVTASIETPLSVLEAMAVNLPVITTRFGAIPRLFPSEGHGVRFLDRTDHIRLSLESLRTSKDACRTRDLVRPYDWRGIGARLKECYEEL